MKRISRRILKTAAVLVLFLLCGMVFQVVVSSWEMQSYPAPGERVDVGGYDLHWNCMGAGDPTVILIHALGGNSVHWALVQPEIAQFTRVCAYDRAGYGWSETSPEPRTITQNVRELRTLIENAGVRGSVVLVGHSYGTHVAQFYADQHPDQVRGLVLIDGGIAAAESEICAGMPGCLPPTARSAANAVISALPVTMRFGVGRLLNRIMPYGESLRFLSAEQQTLYAALINQTQSADANASEWANWEALPIGAPGSLDDLPLVVIHAEATFPTFIYGDDVDLWRERDAALYEAIRSTSSQGRLIVVPGADHASLIFDPEQRQVLVTALQTMTTEAAAGTP